MKLIKIFAIALLVIAFQTLIFAQETPAGKKFAESFWKAIEEEKTYAAASSLDSIKRREPNFDSSKMEKALADLKSKKETRTADARSATRSKIDASNNLNAVFERNLQTDSFTKLDAVKAQIADCEEKTKQILSLDRVLIERDLSSVLRTVERKLSTNDEKNAEILKGINGALSSGNAESLYYELLLRQSYWDNARQVFPDSTAFSTAYSSISQIITNLGTPEQRAAKAEKNLSAKIDAERLPKAAVSDAKLEKWFKDAFEDASARGNKNYTFLKAVIVGTDYYIKRHPVTGIILGRSRSAVIAFKDKDGKCKHGLYAISQEYVGGAFTGAGLSTDVDHIEIRCENVNK